MIRSKIPASIWWAVYCCTILLPIIGIGCSTPSASVLITSFQQKSAGEGDSIAISTEIGNTRMSFGAVRVFRSRMTFQGYRDDSVVVNLWFPPRPFDTARLVVLLGPFGASEVTLYPLALEVIRQGYPVLILPHRGVGLNAHLFADFGFSEITDLRSSLDAYGKYFRIPKVNVGLFGGSLGAAIAVNVAVQDSRVKGPQIQV